MTSVSSQKAFLYETRGSARRRERKELDYQLYGHHATFSARTSPSTKGKFSLSIGKRIDLSKDSFEIKNKNLELKEAEPVILPKCSNENDDSELRGLMRENTDDVPLTDELLQNDFKAQSFKPQPILCAECAKVGLFTKLNKFRYSVFQQNSEQYPCIICAKRKSIKRKKESEKDEKTLLMSIVYPHDFYDRYQSVRRSLKTPTDENDDANRDKKKKTVQQKMVLPKTNVTLPETFSEGEKVVLKPHVVKIKEKDKIRKDKIFMEDSPQAKQVSKEQEPKPTFPSNILPPLPPERAATPKHLRCQPQMKAYFLASLSPRKMLVDQPSSFYESKRPFKGLMLTKSEKLDRPKLPEVKRPVMNVGSLGLTVSIPEYNDKLGNRQTSTNSYLSRAFMSLTNLNRPHSMLPSIKTKVRPPGSIGQSSHKTV